MRRKGVTVEASFRHIIRKSEKKGRADARAPGGRKKERKLDRGSGKCVASSSIQTQEHGVDKNKPHKGISLAGRGEKRYESGPAARKTRSSILLFDSARELKGGEQ